MSNSISILPRHNTDISLPQPCHLPRTPPRTGLGDPPLLSDPTNPPGFSSSIPQPGLGLGAQSRAHSTSFLGADPYFLSDYLLSPVTDFVSSLSWVI